MSASDASQHNDSGAVPGLGQGLPFGTLAFLGAAGSLVTCYGTIAAATLFGIEITTINPHVQAVAMWGMGLVALFALWNDRRRHERSYPLAVAGSGVAILIGSLYLHYDQRFEVLAYVLLVMGALLNQRAMVGRLYDRVLTQAAEIRGFNQTLEHKVDRQVQEIERLSRLKDFLAPSIAELVVAEGRDALLDSHRRYIACLICDVRDFTALSERFEPEETMSILRAFHGLVGDLTLERNGTIGHRAGDGCMVFFNDPVPCQDPVLEAARLALDIRKRWAGKDAFWQRLGQPVGIGIGIASGYATLGLLSDRGQADYTAIGNVVNVTARLCEIAAPNEILIERRAFLEMEESADAEPRAGVELKGLRDPVDFLALNGLRPAG